MKLKILGIIFKILKILHYIKYSKKIRIMKKHDFQIWSKLFED